MSNYIKIQNSWRKVTNLYKKVSGNWTIESETTPLTDNICSFNGVQHSMSIIAQPSITGETLQVNVKYDYEIVSPSDVTFTITTGSGYATINTSGLLTILSGANKSNVTIKADYLGLSKTATINVTYKSGTSTETVIIDNGDGTTTEKTITENSDGSSSTSSIIRDEDGNTIAKENNEVDTKGNSSTQGISVDSEGNEVVTLYTIDTSKNTGGGLDIEDDSVDTGLIPFDGSSGWEMYIYAKFPWSENSGRTYATLVNLMLETSPYPGIVIRYESGSKRQLLIIADGKGQKITRMSEPSDSLYKIRMRYQNKTVYVYNEISGSSDLPESYSYDFDSFDMSSLTARIGSSYDPSTKSAYRFGNCEVYDFTLTKI